jgi:hypothetical protein
MPYHEISRSPATDQSIDELTSLVDERSSRGTSSKCKVGTSGRSVLLGCETKLHTKLHITKSEWMSTSVLSRTSDLSSGIPKLITCRRSKTSIVKLFRIICYPRGDTAEGSFMSVNNDMKANLLTFIHVYLISQNSYGNCSEVWYISL